MSPSEEKEPGSEDPKIIVDSDWKEQVAREKEGAGQAESSKDQSKDEGSADATAAGTDSGGPEKAERKAGEEPLPPPPPATFEVLVSMLFTQAMAALGQMPDPASGKASVNKSYAKHFIDTLEMLGEKTEGNLNENERKILSEALHALRMTYVNVRD